MPELPEVETVVRELDKKLKKLTIKNIEVYEPKMLGLGHIGLGNKRKLTPGIVSEFRRRLVSHKIQSVRRRAKLLMFDITGEQTLLVHLKMTGQFIFEDKAQREKTQGRYRVLNKLSAPLLLLPGKHTHVVFTFTDASKLYYNDVRKFGYMRLVSHQELPKIQELESYGLEPFSPEFSVSYLEQKAKRHSKLSIKQFLMDNRVVAGIGNIYSDEILFTAKLLPRRLVASLSKRAWYELFSAILPVLKLAIKAKGSSVGDFIRTNGTWGQMGKYHYVYGRKGLPCKQCGTLIESQKLGGRTTSFCPKCQR